MRGLYAILDVTSLMRRGLPLLPFAEAVLSARPAALQLRAKDAAPREVLAWLRALAPLAQRAGVPLFANDRPDLAVLGGCDGVHVGQEDLPVLDARRAAFGLRVGLSTHDEAQFERGLGDRPDYLALGPIFPTSTKRDAAPVVGLPLLGRLAARAPCPLVAIGGIDIANARRVGETCGLGAVISALLPAAQAEGGAALLQVARTATALQRALAGGTS